MNVSLGGLSCRIWECADGRFRWHYYSAGKRLTASASTLDAARARARKSLESLRDGKSEIANISTADVSEYLAWKRQREGSLSTTEATTAFLATRKGLSEVYTRTLKADLEAFAEMHKASISEITAQQVDAYLDSLKVGPRRRNNVRGALVALFRWCRQRKYVSDATTAPEMASRAKIHSKDAEVFTPSELRTILSAVGGRWQAALAIQAFAGIRTEEVARLTWDDVDVKKRIIRVSARASKTGRTRLVPMTDNLATFLHGGGNGTIAPAEGMDPLIKRLARQGIKWRKNALRHSYGSYRCAISADPARVAYEMGNSPAMVMAHYHAAQELSTALEWFAIECNQNVTSATSRLRAA